MFRPLFARLNPSLAEGEERPRASIVVPFLIIAVAVGALAWRSYQLSLRMESAANTMAIQYASYAAEITARRVDAAARTELVRASDDWQQVERRTSTPRFASLQEWINANDWIVAAIYVPDEDPASSVYVSEIAHRRGDRVTREFYTSTGTIRFTYDPAKLLDRVKSSAREQPLVKGTGGALAIQQQADISIIRTGKRQGLLQDKDGFEFITPLAPPLAAYAIRAEVRPSYLGRGWENQGLISLVLSFVAIALTGLGAYLTMLGMRKEAETTNLRAALIANVSHELRTPLSMIRLGAETLRRGAKLRDSERKDLEDQILREVLHLSHLVENVLDVARMQHRRAKALAFTPVYPRDLVMSVVTTYESWIRSRGFDVNVSVDESIEEQLWDREAVSRALLNLIDNAMKYSADDRLVEVVLRQDEQHVIIEVKDRGIGIDAKDLTKIFDPYYRAEFSDTQTRRGAGLGLTLVQQIVASHGGRVEVESQRGAGSTFRLLFPHIPAAAPRHVHGLVEAQDTV